MNKKKFSAGSAVALVLSLLLTGIVLFWLLAVWGLQSSPLFVPALVFVLLNMAAILFVTTGGTWLCGSIGFGFYTAICIVTILYTLAQFVHLILCADSEMSTAGYVLYHLIVCFVYLLIVLPLGIAGGGKEKIQNK